MSYYTELHFCSPDIEVTLSTGTRKLGAVFGLFPAGEEDPTPKVTYNGYEVVQKMHDHILGKDLTAHFSAGQMSLLYHIVSVIQRDIEKHEQLSNGFNIKGAGEPPVSLSVTLWG